MPSEPHPAWQLTTDLDGFLAHAEAFLHSAPAPHTALLSVTDTLRARGLQAYGKGAPLFGTYAGADGDVRGAFVRTPPHRLCPSPLDPEAAEALARQLADVSPDLPGVAADAATGEAFARAWEKQTGATASAVIHQRLYRLGTLTPPEPAPPGRARVATGADRELLSRWHEEFGEAVGERPAMGPGAWVDSRLAYGGITLWETPDGTPAAMAGVTRRTAGQVRVAPVYTPAALRGRGYGGAATVAVSRAALDAGASEVLLFTDLDNPTSNSLYQRIGYRPVRDYIQYEFTS
ncbi:GNAT family N-acetyltransferase [Streptomyces formicae]|uniref:GCN5-related N-acetyltransferase n=1 Tax=Streptomyces formicae TaxID=1616117 RepID=A0A291QA25_9ACTN|nr:GNAT family N-acetyltransferase [Streptomyces formicae]ATL28549.1 GCN5-related N-acetyltransferase [Streptomyces formicae]